LVQELLLSPDFVWTIRPSHFGTRVGQAPRVIQLAIRQQPGIGGDRRATKLQQQPTIEIEPQSAPLTVFLLVRIRLGELSGSRAIVPHPGTTYCISVEHGDRRNHKTIQGPKRELIGLVAKF